MGSPTCITHFSRTVCTRGLDSLLRRPPPLATSEAAFESERDLLPMPFLAKKGEREREREEVCAILYTALTNFLV